MYRVVQTIKGTLFWGTLFLAGLYFGLKLPLEDLWYEATNGNIFVKIVSIYLLISPVAWIILAVVEAVLNVRDGMRVICCIGASFLPNFWPVYKFLDWREPEPENMIYHIIRGLVWYGFIGFCVWSVVNQVPNRIMQRIEAYNTDELLMKLGIFVGACLVLWFVAFILMEIVFRILREDVKYID